MNQQILKKLNQTFFLFCFCFSILHRLALASNQIEAPCGILENFEGEIQVLDETRKKFKDGNIKLPLLCDSWITIHSGWAKIRHQNGQNIHLAENTFIKLNDFKKKSEFLGDHIILFKGQIFVQSENDQEEFKMVTTSGRARLKQGKVIFIYDQTQESSQLISLAQTATLENRFESSKKIKIKEGESTSFNFQLLRILPQLPSPVSVASIRPLLTNLHVSEADQIYAVRAVTKREERKFASTLVREGDLTPQKNSTQQRGLASESTPPPLNTYLRHQPDPMDSVFHEHWVKKMVGGEEIGEKILFPDRFYGKSQKIQVNVNDPSENQRAQRVRLNQVELKEKKKLLEELSQIHVE